MLFLAQSTPKNALPSGGRAGWTKLDRKKRPQKKSAKDPLLELQL
jgi:hypothetical protein